MRSADMSWYAEYELVFCYRQSVDGALGKGLAARARCGGSAPGSGACRGAASAGLTAALCDPSSLSALAPRQAEIGGAGVGAGQRRGPRAALCPAPPALASSAASCARLGGSCLTVKGKDDLPLEIGIQPEREREDGYFLESNKVMKLDANLPSCVSKDSNDMVLVELLDNGECILEVKNVQQSITLVEPSRDNLSNQVEALSKPAAAKSLKDKCAEQVCKEKTAIGVVVKVQDSEACVKKATQTHAESLSDFHKGKETASPNLTAVPNEFISRTGVYSVDEAAGDSKNSVQQEEERDGSVLQYKAERVHITDESCNPVGAVNKALLKVIRSDSLDEAAEWKRLQQITAADRNLPGSIYEKRTTVSRGSSKHLFLNLPVSEGPDVSQTETALKDDFTERLTNLDVSNRDEDTWVLDCRLGQSSPFAHSCEKEKINRNVLHLSLELNNLKSFHPPDAALKTRLPKKKRKV
ncbi:Formin-1 isoform X3 [Aix galericulata]|nr:Formin-1 isoform X3 [Aix galericulata]